MIIPIRCFSCGKPVSHVWEEFKEKYDSKEDLKKALDDSGLKRQCCRGLFLSHIDTVEIISQYKRG